MKKIAIFFAEGYEEIEALTVVDLCRRAGILVDMVSVTDSLQVTGAHGIPVVMDKMLAEVEFDTLDMLVLPGGMPGTRNLEQVPLLMEQVKAFAAAGKYIAAICAAPSVLGRLGILQGKQATCYPGFEAYLGESYIDGLVVESKNIITAKGPGLSSDFAFCLVEKLAGSEVADQVYDAAQY